MKYSENVYTPLETRIYCGVVTSRYKKYRPVVLEGFIRISDNLVTIF
jgi:hypothetical protein